MPQSTRQWFSEKVEAIRKSPTLPFYEILDSHLFTKSLQAENVHSHSCVFTPLITLCVFLSQVLDPDHSCRSAVARLNVWLSVNRRKACSPETSTYCEARQRLPLGVIKRLVCGTSHEVDGQALDKWLWKGRRVTMVDGTTVSMPDTRANQREFPQPSSQVTGVGFPLARIVVLISLCTGVVRDLAVGPYAGKETGETALLRTLWESLETGEILLGDRYFASFFGMIGLKGRGVDGLFRMHQRRKCDFRRGRRLGVEDHVVTWTKPIRPSWMDEATYAQIPEQLTIRELRIRVSIPGYRVNELVLVTTLLDSESYTKDELADLFMKRWNVELDLRSIKCTLQMDILRCKTPEMVRKEIWMHMLAYNLIRELMARAANVHDMEPREISFKGALQTVNEFRHAFGHAADEERTQLLVRMLEAIASHRVGDRPKRVEPRLKKRRPKPTGYLAEPRSTARNRLTGKA